MAESNFIDYVKIYCASGHGGAGSMHLHRAKYIPKGGPDGGDGGRGGHIILRANAQFWTLIHLKYRKHIKADDGERGGAALCKGKNGEDIILDVPVGTVVKDAETGEQLFDLAENGQDPANQLCTDDFAGHLAHNANLSLKAIYGVAGYALMCRMKGDTENYEKYYQKALSMSQQWKSDAIASDNRHYKLTLDDRNDSWSQKYNLIWDKLWKLNWLDDVVTTEITYYRNHQKTYGLPLDSRSDYTKSDWIMWTAAMSPNNSVFNVFGDRVWKYVNETTSRVPISDWYWTTNGRMQGFRARSVVGGHWMKVLVENFDPNVPLNDVKAITDKGETVEETARYNLGGQLVTEPQSGVNIVRYSNGEVKKVIVK